MTKLDFGLSLGNFPFKTLPSLGKVIEENGFTRVWINDEETYRSAYATAAILGLSTSKIKIGPGLTNPYTRHPLITGVELATLHTEFPGRGILGIGPGDYWFLQARDM